MTASNSPVACSLSAACFAHLDRQRDVVGVLADDAAQPEAVEELVLALAQVQHDFGAASGLLDCLQGVSAVSGRNPAHALGGRQAGLARGQGHLVGDDEGGVETDAELADQLRVLRLVAGQRFEELPGAGPGDGADVVDHFVARHADATVRHRDGTRRLVEIDTDTELRVTFV